MNMATWRRLLRAGRGWLLCAAALLASCGGGGDKADEQVARLELAPQGLLLTGAGQERQLSARALNASGAQIDAKVVWTSSAPDQVRVDSNGKVTSVTPIGSALVFAEAGGFRSPPVLISTVELKPGTLLLRDADIVQVVPPLLAPGVFPGAGTLYDIWIAGTQAPAPGTIVLAAETANVSGRVVETAIEPNRVRVRLARLAMPDLIARYDVNWTIDLAPYDLVIDEGTAQSRKQSQRAATRALAATASALPEWKIPEEGSQSPCSASVEAKLKAKPLQVKVSGSPKVEVVSSKLDATLPPGRLRVALVGDFYIETSVGLTAEAGLTGEVKCELKGHIPLPFLPVPLNLILKVPVGLGVAASGKVEVVSIDIGLSGKNGATFEMGIDCAPPQPCRGLDSAQRINEITPHLELNAEAERMKIELEAGAYFLTGIDAVFGIANASYQYNLLDVKVGPKQKADFGTLKRQLDVVPYASTYDLAFVLEVGPGQAIKDAIKELMGDDPGELSFGLNFSLPIAESPRGTWQPDKASVIPNRDSVRFDVDITEFSKAYWKLGYNIDRIEVYHRREGEPEFSLLRTLGAAEPQRQFNTTWAPTPADAGSNDFAVFAVSKLPVVRLELASMKSVQVGCIAGTGSAQGRMQALAAAGVCRDVWGGTVTTRLTRSGGGLTGSLDATITATVAFESDPTAPQVPGTLFYRLRGGSYTYDWRLEQPARNPPCRTIERASGTMGPGPLNPLRAGSTTATLDLVLPDPLLPDPQSTLYLGSGATAVDIVQTSNCNDRNTDETITLPGMTLVWWAMQMRQPLAADGITLEGSGSNPDGLGGTIAQSWRLMRSGE